MPLTETIVLNITTAQRQIDQLEADLAKLSKPIDVRVDVEGTRAADEIRQDFDRADSSVNSLNNELEETGRELRNVDRQADNAADGILRVGTRGASAFTSLRGSILGVGAAFAAIAGARAFIGFAGQAIDAASDFEESLSKTNVVFGAFSKNIQNFATNAPQALGLSTAAALEATSTFGNLFVALGLTQQEAANLSPNIVQLAADLASFNNIEVGEAVEKLRSGLVGEAEPLRVLGVNLTEATVQAKALELGLGGTTGTLTEAAKVQARYALILEQTATAQGDFARTADGIANTQRTLTAEFQNVSQKIGEALLPAFQALLDAAPAVIDLFEDLAPVIAAAATSAGNAAPQLESVATAIQSASVVPGLVGAAFQLAGSGAVILAGALDQALTGIVSGTRGLELMDKGIRNIGDTIDNLDVAKIEDTLVRSLIAGQDPALALVGTFEDLAKLDLRPEQFEDAAAAFTKIANLNPSRLRDLSRFIRDNRAEMRLTAGQAKDLHEQLAILLAPSVFSPEAGRGNLAESLGIDESTVPALTDTAAAILEVANAGGDLADFAPDFKSIDIDQLTEDLARSAEGLSNAFRDALADEEGEVASDAAGFVDRVIENIKAEAAFAANINQLRAAGAEMAAAFFEDLGAAEGAETLAALVNDPEQVARLNAEADRIGRDAAINTTNSFKQAMEEESFETLNLPPIAVPAFLDFGPLPTFTGIREVGVPKGGDTNIIFNDTPQPTTDTTRIVQSIAAIRQ